jgi:diguanylate cyclase (GGDEF)-like protein/PAS domain S-box-containing protein
MLNMRLLRYYGLPLLILLFLSALLFFAIERQLKTRLEADLRLESNVLINQLSKQTSLAFVDIKSDLGFLGEQDHLHQLGPSNDDVLELHELEHLWTSFSYQRGRYDQIRFLDTQGKEVIRVNYKRGNPVAVPREKLQSKRNRYYFSEAINLSPGEIYVSPLDLNIENHAVELPLKPMIRFATPISNPDAKVIGVLVLNYLAQKLLDDFRRTSAEFSGDAMLANTQGYLLLSPDSAQDWNFMFPDSPQTGIHSKHPAIWQQIKDSLRGQITTTEGIFTYDTLSPAGRQSSPDCASCLKILLHVPTELINNKLSRKLHERLPPLIFTLALVGLISIVLLWHRDKRRTQEKEISSLNDLISFERDLFVSGPGIIVKLRNELGWPVDYISNNVQGLLGYRQVDFQTGGLTYSSLIEASHLSRYIAETEQAELDHQKAFKRSAYQVVDRQGHHRWVQDFCQAIRDKQGRISHYFSHISDISALKSAEEKLKASRDAIQKVVDTIPDPTLVIDIHNHQLQLANQAARDLYNDGRPFNSNMTCYRLSHKRDAPCAGSTEPCPIEEVLKTGLPSSVRHKHYDGQGGLLFIDVRATPLFDEHNQRIVQIIESHRDVTETVKMEKQLQHIANTDRLTQTYNRLKFDEELKHQIEWAKLTGNALGLIMFDIDHFKRVNDKHGHATGDEVLQRTVDIVRRHIRRSDTLARWGGEEFMIITPLTDALELKSISESLRSYIEDIKHETAGIVTASFGASVLKPDDSFTSFIKRVDTALYQSKQQGRNRCTVME